MRTIGLPEHPWILRGAVAVGGMAGTGLRLVVGEVVEADGWPWATFVANVSGALLLGFLLPWFRRSFTDPTGALSFLGTGLLGSYTTFSAFSVETWQLASDAGAAAAVGYAAVSLFAGLGFAGFGAMLASRTP